MNKKKAIEVFKKYLNKEECKGEFYISAEQIPMSSVTDAMNQSIFHESLDCSCWLIFHNPCIEANWSHHCVYYGILDSGKIVVNSDTMWLPSSSIVMERLMAGDCNE